MQAGRTVSEADHVALRNSDAIGCSSETMGAKARRASTWMAEVKVSLKVLDRRPRSTHPDPQVIT